MEEKKDWKEELQDIINREMFKEDLMIQIKSLVEQELDKAREEGVKQYLEEVVNKNTSSQGISYGDIAEEVVRKLSKLKDNK